MKEKNTCERLRCLRRTLQMTFLEFSGSSWLQCSTKATVGVGLTCCSQWLCWCNLCSWAGDLGVWGSGWQASQSSSFSRTREQGQHQPGLVTLWEPSSPGATQQNKAQEERGLPRGGRDGRLELPPTHPTLFPCSPSSAFFALFPLPFLYT